MSIALTSVLDMKTFIKLDNNSEFNNKFERFSNDSFLSLRLTFLTIIKHKSRITKSTKYYKNLVIFSDDWKNCSLFWTPQSFLQNFKFFFEIFPRIILIQELKLLIYRTPWAFLRLWSFFFKTMLFYFNLNIKIKNVLQTDSLLFLSTPTSKFNVRMTFLNKLLIKKCLQLNFVLFHI